MGNPTNGREQVFVDTSALYALLDRADANHGRAAKVFPGLLASARLLTHSYVLVEATALVQHRLGMPAVRRLADDLTPCAQVIWVGEQLHLAAIAALIASGQRNISLVDYVSFDVMRRHGLRKAFAFDADFARQGFDLVAA